MSSQTFDAETVDAIFSERDQLKAENAKLREYITKLEQANIVLDSDNTELRNDMRDMQMIVSDNNKLRELLLHMYTCMGNVDADGNHECFSCEYEGAECDYDRRMRELGIEV